MDEKQRFYLEKRIETMRFGQKMCFWLGGPLLGLSLVMLVFGWRFEEMRTMLSVVTMMSLGLLLLGFVNIKFVKRLESRMDD